MFKTKGLFLFITGLFFANISAVELATKKENVELFLNGSGFFRFGQIVRGTGLGTATEEYLWTENANAGLSVVALFDKKLKLVLGVDVDLKFTWPWIRQVYHTRESDMSVNLGETYGLYTLEGKSAVLELCAGYFGYKYNPDVRNLGEYLFRSGTYPALIVTDFDDPQAKLLGFRVGNKLFDKSFSHDLLLSSETVFYPTMDWSLSYLFNYNLLNLGFLNIGAGISWAHLFSVYYDAGGGNATSPKYGTLYYINGSDSTQRDSAYYTFKGSKLMTRFSIDPLSLIRDNNTYFGENDLKIYAELLVIGLKSYPDSTAAGSKTPSYSDWKDKAPVTFGINIPTFGLLDVMNLEFEYFGSKYYNDFRQIYEDGRPLAPPYIEGLLNESKWKWSLYLKKSFFKGHCAITTQFARDHMRMFSVSREYANNREMLIENGNWWWISKLSFSF